MKRIFIMLLLVSDLFTGCGRHPTSSNQLKTKSTNAINYGSFLSIEFVDFEGIEAITNFTGVVKSVTLNMQSHILVTVQKTIGADQSEVVIIETNLAARNLESLTNLVVGKTYVFPECVSPKYKKD